jgi:hypothetical protein
MFTFFVAFFKAIPAFKSIVDTFIELWILSQDRKDETNAENRQKKRESLIVAIKQEGLSNEQRSHLRSLLYSLR